MSLEAAVEEGAAGGAGGAAKGAGAEAASSPLQACAEGEDGNAANQRRRDRPHFGRQAWRTEGRQVDDYLSAAAAAKVITEVARTAAGRAAKIGHSERDYIILRPRLFGLNG